MQLLILLVACGNNDSETPACTDAFYADSDADGYGDTAHPTTACSIPSGYAVTGDDCDDTNAAAHPGADEMCDALDNDCDEDVDEDAVDVATWYADTDGDGFGDDLAATQQCAQPSGSVDVGGDCDDTNLAVHPGVAEVCDGIDNDCDDSVDVGAVDATTWYADTDADGFGDDLAADQVCVQPSGTVDIGGDCGDSDPAVNPDGTEICDDGLDNDCDGWACFEHYLSVADAKLVGEEGGDTGGDFAGDSVSGAGDMDGDGHDDLLVGASGNDEGGTGAGAAYLVLGPLSGTLDLSEADAKFVGEETGDGAGICVSGAGDVDGDGRVDVLIGAFLGDDGDSGAGAAYLVLGPVTGTVGLSLADAKLVGEAAGDYAWNVSDAGDVNDDRHDDLLVGSRSNDEGGSSAGAAYVVLGPVSGTLDLSDADAKLLGETAGANAGSDVSAAGDVDGDGNDDVVVGAYNAGNTPGRFGSPGAGAAYVVLGPVTGTLDLSLADAKFVGEETLDYAGISVSGAGDVNADGHDDLLVGAWLQGASDRGAAYVVLGSVTGGTLDLSLADAKLVGEDTGDEAGWAVSGGGDVDDDGHADVLVVAVYAAPASAAYLVRGPVTGTLYLSVADVKLVGEEPGDQAGVAVSDAGDMDGDGRDDLLVGAWFNDEGGTYAGAAYLVYGGGLSDVGGL